MASISQLRPRSAEAEALVSRLSSEDNIKMDTQAASEDDDSSEHSNSGAMSGQVYNTMQQALQCTSGNMLTIAKCPCSHTCQLLQSRTARLCVLLPSVLSSGSAALM